MNDNNDLNVDIEVPFPSKRLAEIVYHVLRVDEEPKRSGVTKELSFAENVLYVKFKGFLARQLRVAVTSFFENLRLITETIQFAGPPVSENYEHF